MKYIWELIIIIAAVAILLGLAAFILCRPENSASQPVRPGWVKPNVISTSSWPHLKKTAADEKLKDRPAGTKLIEIQTPQGIIQVEITPQGEVLVPEGTQAVVYVKPLPKIGWEFRPWLAGGAEGHATGIRPAIAVGVDVVRAWRLHAGPGVVVSQDNVAGLVTGTYTPWRNVDLRAGGGYGTSGATAFIGIGVGIE